MYDLVLPTFAMDCRDWLVITPEEAGLPDEVGGAPLLAVLSTVLLDGEGFYPASGVLTVGLLDTDLPPSTPVPGAPVAARLVEGEEDSGVRRYVMPAPDRRLAMLAEFTLPDGPLAGLVARVEALMASFRWAG
jgi:hypothetical protein